MAEVTLGFVDVETTGLSWEKGDHIFEVALCLYRADGLNHTAVGSFSKRVNPGVAVSKRAAEITGVTWADLANEPPYSKLAPNLDKLFSQIDVLIAHNGDHFDIPFIRAEQNAHGFFTFPKRTFDTMQQARWATFNGKLPKLGELCMATATPYQPELAHGALYDTEVMAQAFFKAQSFGFFPQF